MVASPTFRHPVHLAKEAMTLDHVSGGRVTLGIGAGGTGYDASVFGEPVLSPRQRVDRYIEFVEVVDALLRQPFTTHRTDRYVIEEAPMLPGCVQQPRLPLALAAGGPRTLALAARFADAWITYGDTSTEVRPASATETKVQEQSERLAEECGAIGRDPEELDRIYLIGNTDERPLASLDAFEDFAHRYRELGFTDLVFHHPRPGDPVWSEPEAIVHEIATQLLPGLR